MKRIEDIIKEAKDDYDHNTIIDIGDIQREDVMYIVPDDCIMKGIEKYFLLFGHWWVSHRIPHFRTSSGLVYRMVPSANSKMKEKMKEDVSVYDIYLQCLNGNGNKIVSSKSFGFS